MPGPPGSLQDQEPLCISAWGKFSGKGADRHSLGPEGGQGTLTELWGQ